jgi:hypothetical protein
MVVNEWITGSKRDNPETASKVLNAAQFPEQLPQWNGYAHAECRILLQNAVHEISSAFSLVL